MEQLIEITLDGNKYRLRAHEDAELVREAANLVNDQLEEVRKSVKASSPFQVALLGALHLALKLKKLSADVKQFQTETASEIQSISEGVEEQIRSIQPLVSGSSH